MSSPTQRRTQQLRHPVPDTSSLRTCLLSASVTLSRVSPFRSKRKGISPQIAFATLRFRRLLLPRFQWNLWMCPLYYWFANSARRIHS